MDVKQGDTIDGVIGTVTFATGAATNADSTPTCVVLEAGTALGYAPTFTNKATGLYNTQIVASSGNGFDVGTQYSAYAVVVMGGVTARGPIEGASAFTCRARCIDDLCFPTTSGRSLDVTTTGEAGIDWANIGAPTTTVNLSGTTVKTATDVATDVTTLLGRLTSTRAGYLDNLSGGAVALNADIATLLTRLSAARAGYLDNLSAGAVALNADMATVLTRLSAARAGYLDNLSAGAVALAATALSTVQWTNTRAGYLDNIGAGTIAASSDIATLLSRLSAARAGYLDNLSAGAVALASALATVQADTDDIQTRLPAALTGGKMDSTETVLEGRLTSARAGYLDNLSGGAVALASALATAQTAITAIKAKTDNLPVDPADASDIAAAFATVNATLATIAGYVDTEIATIIAAVAAVQSDTDNIQTRLPVALDGTGFMKSQVKGMDADTLTATALKTDAATKIITTLYDTSHRAGRTFRGVVRRMDSFMTGKATGLRGALARWFAPDGVTVEFSGAQDISSGTRDTSDCTASETP